ncbi:MerR family transcriptional regulator [Rhodococcus sp. KBS0724]|uniref:MerR family transcriptional regulator n=1 Tax=Rhodococcus sp. KBS0724 TaxID=1179674 RepID=UPI00110DAA54|nr:TipAS antibiotic-recognition domain-containing protein [Rhodococcus sp. KBS0724]TSD45681.1 MerR family transcriptional regulator [Rhodococcus sp. KBS0724]
MSEWSIQELAKAAGTTSRTLRHYGDVGLLKPHRTGAGGYRFYDNTALIRLQRILLLRELGLGLPAIAEILGGERDTATALHTHLELLEQERARIDRQIESVTTTLRKTEKGLPLMPEEVFDGFDHAHYKDEVIERWGSDAYTSGDAWWRSKSEQDKKSHLNTHKEIAAAFGKAAADGLGPESETVQEITHRQFAWVETGWQGKAPSADAFIGLGRMYVDDPRFRANYDIYGPGTAELIRDAMAVYAETNLR